ncbi:hypothetical protein BU17DRAFT_95236 [Hysterangium stoloniferum]|nr:hypothetical protein BU17DRAFT_95236 [Hysterangium stoloniferum]
MNSTACIPQWNADIAGRGVRISFYLQNLILVLLVRRSNEDAENALWTLIATSFGLTVAAWQQVAINQLTLLQGILVSQLTWLAICGMNLGLAAYTDAEGNDSVVKVAAVLQILWCSARHLPLPNCELTSTAPVKHVILFGLILPALDGGRDAALSASGLLLALYTISTAYDTYFWIRSCIKRRIRRGRPASRSSQRMHPHLQREPEGGDAQMLEMNLRLNFGLEERFHRFSQRLWPGGVEPVFLAIVILQTLITVYFIATTELVIVKNGVGHDDTVWGFGQILAFIVAIPSLLAFYRATREQFRSKNWGRPEPIAMSEPTHDIATTDMPVGDTAASSL